jgi:hypothetical protein
MKGTAVQGKDTLQDGKYGKIEDRLRVHKKERSRKDYHKSMIHSA